MHDQQEQEGYRDRWAGCRKSFTDVTGTIFAYRQAPLAEGCFCMQLGSFKCATVAIAEEMGISYALADSMVKQVGQRFFDSPDAAKLRGHVELDERYQHAGEKGTEQTERNPRCRANDKRGRGTVETDRVPLVGFVQRDGTLRFVVTDHVQKKPLNPS